MLFRDKNDFLITMCKHEYTNDTAYYNAIMKLKQQLYKRHENLNMNHFQGLRKISNVKS